MSQVLLVGNEDDIAIDWPYFDFIIRHRTNCEGKYEESKIINVIIPKQVIEEHNIKGIKIVGFDVNHNYIQIHIATNKESEPSIMQIKRDPSKEDEYWYPIK